MENMDSGSSLDMDEVINMNEQCLVFKETELWKENVNLIEKSNLGNTVSSSYEISAPTNIGLKLGPSPLQDNVENIRIDEQMPQIDIFLSMHPKLASHPQHCSFPSTSGIYSNTVTQVQHSTSVNPTTNLLDNKGDFSGTQTVQNSRENNPSPECEGKNSQQYSQDKTWHEVLKMYQLEPQATSDQLDTKKEEAVWELFTSECNYFLDHLLVLKMNFLDTLKYLQSKELLSDVDPELLFANLEELNQMTIRNFSDNKNWCERNKECKRLRLAEMLVAPLHKLTRYPLLLKNIWKNTDAAEKVIINSLKEKVETSIRDLEGKVKWLDNFQKFKQLQEIIIWPSLWDQDKRHFVPEKFDLSLTPACSFFSLELQSLLEEGGNCIVLSQPIPLDRMMVKNIDSFHITVIERDYVDDETRVGISSRSNITWARTS
ncbi:hypothetical protein E2320_003909 [Naja naja]|nr:hypothetical protein E2320_003909 [Naja naja]